MKKKHIGMSDHLAILSDDATTGQFGCVFIHKIQYFKLWINSTYKRL